MSVLGEQITRNSSFQTYITFRLLADPEIVQQSLDGYAYFRWLDDEIDLRRKTMKARVACIRRQKKIISAAYARRNFPGLLPEERLIYDLIFSNPDPKSKLASFIKNFVRIIEFDATRKNRTVTGKQLTWYSDTLAVAVIDCIEYFINHSFQYPARKSQYSAAVGAHITHMLRDYHEDLDEGFVNIPSEYLKNRRLDPRQTGSPAFTDWVRKRVQAARKHLAEGMEYWDGLPVLRGKIAARWYCCRFENVLNRIEKDGFVLRKSYPRKRNPASFLKIIWVFMKVIVRHYINPRPAIAYG